MLKTCGGTVRGEADDRLGSVIDRLEGHLAADPDYSFQMTAYVGGQLVLDVHGGRHLEADSLMVPASVSKNALALSVGLLVQRGLLDLDAPVREWWPEFATAGKERVTTRQLLSHQAGLPEADPILSWDEILDHHAGSERLARSRPFWHPGSAFGYHALTIGNLVDTLVQRIDGRTVQGFYEDELRSRVGADFFLGLPPEHDSRLVTPLELVPPLGEPPAPTRHNPMLATAFGPRPGEQIDMVRDERSWRFGHPAVSAATSARGIATLLAAATTGIDGTPALLDADTVSIIGEQQVRGYDEVLGQDDRAHAIVFQKPSQQLAFGGPRSFGHDGAMGALGCADPSSGVAFGYTVARGPWPGGGDPRAVRAAREIGEMAW
ncbi:serine hydrolase domain-containing protein [Microbacterium halotolerans]|uniref:serine hydrolase domain-containing protein n=1 Tax=Microbacterium halotolerans TaxID=246613 RepID=UPI000E6A9544|nr:serine hydrolase domain-containing protein [Microbacterium halotolerans]